MKYHAGLFIGFLVASLDLHAKAITDSNTEHYQVHAVIDPAAVQNGTALKYRAYVSVNKGRAGPSAGTLIIKKDRAAAPKESALVPTAITPSTDTQANLKKRIYPLL